MAMKTWLLLSLLWGNITGSAPPSLVDARETHLVPLLPPGEKTLGEKGINFAILEKQVIPTQRLCQLSAYVIDRDPQGLNIRNAPNPNAQIMGNLPTYDQTMTVNIIASQGNWVQINQADGDSGEVFQGRGWVYAPLLGTSTRGYARKGVSVYANPNNRSRAIGRIPDQVGVKLLSCDRQWAYVSYEKLQGWLAPIDQCPNALTTCP
jgi:SH3-like domain-containing protein